jgi:AcrR family transcriptional regulator
MARRLTLSEDEVLRRARRVFVEQGYAAGTREIAAAVGLTWGALVLRFGEKRKLFRRAMLDPLPGAGAAGWNGAVADLAVLLEQTRVELWEQWPRRLQYRLAERTAVPDEDWLALAERLALTLQAQASRGAVRFDIGSHELAQLVLDLLVGDVARRFVRAEPELRADPALIERVLRLLEPCATEAIA